MSSSYETQSELLRIVYTKYMRKLFNLKSILLQRLSRDTETWCQGEGISIPLHWEGTGGMGWSNTGRLPKAGEQRAKRAQFNYYTLYGAIELDGRFMRRAAKGYASEVQPFNFESMNMVRQIRAGLNKDLWGDGSGILANIVSCSDNRTLVVDSAYGLKSNDIVDVRLISDGSAQIAEARISVNAKTKTVTIKAGEGVLVDPGAINTNPELYAIYRQGSRNAAMMGLAGIVSESNPPGGNYGGIDRSTAGNEPWHGMVDSNSGTPRQLTFRLMQDMKDRIEQESDGETSIIMCSPQVWTPMAERLVGEKVYGGERMTLNGWCNAVLFDGVPVVKDKHCPPNKMYFLDESHLAIYQDSEGEWVDYDGAVLSRISGEDRYEATWVRELELVCNAPNAQGVIEDIDPLQEVG